MRYTNALILTVIMILSFVFLFILNEYQNTQKKPMKLPCSSYINTNCEGYRVPMCERE